MAATGTTSPGLRTRVRLCGLPVLEIDGRDAFADLPEGQRRLLLIHLLAHRNRPVDRDSLIEVVWPEGPPDNAKANLRVIVSKLRRVVAPAELEGRERVRLVLPEPVWVDLDEALGAIEAARAAGRRAAWTEAIEHARAGLDLLRPGFVSGVDAAWLDDRRAELEDLELEALEWIARAGLALGGADLPEARRAAEELVTRSPFRESGHGLRMEAMAAGGNVAEALQAYEELRTLLRDELGVAPSPEVQALHQRLLDGDVPAAGRGGPRRAHVPLPSLLRPRDGGTMVGREAELQALRDVWAAARDGSRRFAVLCGEPGIGKTRLSGELAREAHEEGTVLYAAVVEDALVSYQPFVEALRHYAREGPPLSLGPGGAELARLIPELAERHEAGDPTAAGDDPETRRYLLFEAVSALLTEIAERAPLLLVIDDLHWADRPTLQLLHHVVRAGQQAPLLVLGTYREAEVTADHPLAKLLADLRRDRMFERVVLRGLDSDSVGTLIESRAGRVSSELVRSVHAETAGNPFFVEEVVLHLLESDADLYGLTLPDIGVPEGVKEVLTRRLSRLSETCRGVLAHAAVLGREFTFDLLPAMASIDEDTVIAALEEALDAQLVVEDGPQYAFTHALVRETLYGKLSAPRRQRIHALAAFAIEAAEGPDSDARVAALAVHYRLAGPSVDPAKGIEYSLRAGERARQNFAWEEATSHWAGALALMERAGSDTAGRIRLLEGLAVLSTVAGELGRQIEYLDRALALAHDARDDERAARIHSRLGMAHSLIDSIDAEHLDIRRAFVHFDAARAVLERGPVRKALGHLKTGIASAFTYGADTEAGLEAAAQAMEIGERFGDEALWAGAAQAYGWHCYAAGRLGEAADVIDRAFEVSDRERRPFLAWMGTNIRGQMTWGLGDPDGAQEFFDRHLTLPYAGKTSYAAEVADGIGRCHASRGELDRARRLLPDARPAWITHSLRPVVDLWDGNWDAVAGLAARVLATSRRTGNRWDEWAAHHLAARVMYLRGDLARAASALEEARAIVLHGGARYFELWVLTDLARVRAEAGDLGDARAHVDRAREITGNGDDWRGRAGVIDVSAGVVLSLGGDAGEADACFERGLATLRRYRLAAEEADALHQWALARARAGDDSAAKERIEEAGAVLRRCGAGDLWLRRLREDAGGH